MLGSGDARLVGALRVLAELRPDAIALIERFDRALARKIYAGIDLFVMPSRFEPCGQGQMIALRYGSPPIVRRTGGLRDTVVDEISAPGRGTGFAFDDATPDALFGACDAAITAYETGGAAWDGLVSRGMAVDFDWTTGLKNTSEKSLSSIRIVSGLKRLPTGCCIQALAMRIHKAEKLDPSATHQVTARWPSVAITPRPISQRYCSGVGQLQTNSAGRSEAGVRNTAM